VTGSCHGPALKLARLLSRSAAVAATLMLLSGCASAPPTPVTDIEPLVGKWSGTVNIGGSLLPFYLTINADRTLVATWGISWNYGRITITNGQATYQMSPPPTEGTMRLYRDDGKLTLYMDDLWLTFHAIVTKPTGSMPAENPSPAPSG
jgi:hypothetical protein